MIDHQNKFIFIHIPKTGGVSIERSLGHNGLRHETLSAYKNKEYFKFTFVRNPYDLLVSWYNFQPGLKDLYKDFRKWVRFGCPSHIESEVLNKRPLGSHEYEKDYISVDGTTWSIYEHLQQHRWAVDMDYIGRFENLQKDFDKACDIIGVSKRKLPHHNKTKHEHYTMYYDNETQDLVAKLYQKDLKEFGYSFSTPMG